MGQLASSTTTLVNEADSQELEKIATGQSQGAPVQGGTRNAGFFATIACISLVAIFMGTAMVVLLYRKELRHVGTQFNAEVVFAAGNEAPEAGPKRSAALWEQESVTESVYYRRRVYRFTAAFRRTMMKNKFVQVTDADLTDAAARGHPVQEDLTPVIEEVGHLGMGRLPFMPLPMLPMPVSPMNTAMMMNVNPVSLLAPGDDVPMHPYAMHGASLGDYASTLQGSEASVEQSEAQAQAILYQQQLMRNLLAQQQEMMLEQASSGDHASEISFGRSLREYQVGSTPRRQAAPPSSADDVDSLLTDIEEKLVIDDTPRKK